MLHGIREKSFSYTLFYLPLTYFFNGIPVLLLLYLVEHQIIYNQSTRKQVNFMKYLHFLVQSNKNQPQIMWRDSSHDLTDVIPELN